MCEDGATVAATYLLFGETVRAGLVRAERAAILHGDLTLQETPIKYHKCPTFDTKRKFVQTNVQTNAGDFQTFKLIGPPKQIQQMKLIRCR